MHSITTAILVTFASTAAAAPMAPAQSTPSIVDRQTDVSSEYLYPLIGKFAGTNGDSCGYIAEELGPVPLRADCDAANAQWSEQSSWYSRFGRQSQVAASCVLVWHPESDIMGMNIPSTTLQAAFVQLFDACPIGVPFYVTNYAYHVVDHTQSNPWWGSVSVYHIDMLPDP